MPVELVSRLQTKKRKKIRSRGSDFRESELGDSDSNAFCFSLFCVSTRNLYMSTPSIRIQNDYGTEVSHDAADLIEALFFTFSL